MFSCRNSIVRTGVALLTSGACAACTTITVQPEELTSITRVAIVGFEAIDQFGTTSIDSNYVYGTDVGSGSSTLDALVVASAATADVSDALTTGGDGENASAYPQTGAFAYDTLVEMMQSALGVEIVTREELVANEAYATEFSQKMAFLDPSKRDVSAGPPTPKPFTVTTYYYPVDSRAVPIGLIWSRMLAEQDPADRDAFMDRLGVDAIVLSQIIWHPGNVERPMAGAPIEVVKVHHPAATVNLVMYKRGVLEPVWHEKGARGCSSVNGVVTTMGVRDADADLTSMVNSASSHGVRAAIKRLTDAMTPEESRPKRSFGTTRCL